jgi:GNAT superfamily N-acetyltransferase
MKATAMLPITIAQATGAGDLDAVRALMRRYVGWHYQRHAAHRAMIARYFERAEFEAELAALPGRFAPPSGRLLLARVSGGPAGCVALRDLGGGACEMKRMFVAPEHQGRGIGRALGRTFLAEAAAAGYRVARLDTGPLQHEAHRLYARLGFRRVAPYYDVDADMAAFLIMERPLRTSVALGEELADQVGAALPCGVGGGEYVVGGLQRREARAGMPAAIRWPCS